MKASRLLVLMGSGETAPTMVKPHREIFDRLDPPPVPSVILDTPYGFQENAADISARAVEYFAQSVGRAVDVADLPQVHGADPLSRERALARIAAARWIFAGPGSPTYALQEWRDSDVPALLSDRLEHGGCVVFASAAALTLGRYTVPVYEIYKVGIAPAWAEGLGLFRALGDNVAVIPHYDNAEGGNHDTRFCYLGERRLRMLEGRLPDNGWVLGVDEHTACVADLEQKTATILGRGGVTVRRHGRSVVFPAGETVPFSVLLDAATGKTDTRRGQPAVPPPGSAAGSSTLSEDRTPLHGEVRRLEADFDAALAASDPDGAVKAALDLEDTLEAWANDTTQSDARPRGRAALRRMVVRLGELSWAGVQDPAESAQPYVEVLLAERAAARAERRFTDADRVRDRLIALGVEVRDTPDGTTWSLHPRVP